MTTIYALCEPGTRTVRYIGKTFDFPRRVRNHVTTSPKLGTPLGRWLRALSSAPVMVSLREVPDEEGAQAEKKYIRIALGLGMKLLNRTNGGQGTRLSPEHRAKISVALTGRKFSAERRAGLSASHIGKPWSAARRAAERYLARGRKMPPRSIQWRERMAASQRGKRRIFSAEHRVNLSASRLGKPLSLAHRAALSAARQRNLKKEFDTRTDVCDTTP